MANQVIEGDRLFFIAESLAQEFSSFPNTDLEQKPAPGLLSQREVNQLNDNIASLDISTQFVGICRGAQPLLVSGWVKKATYRTGFLEASIHDPSGELVATAQSVAKLSRHPG